jgi:hypothetical protein
MGRSDRSIRRRNDAQCGIYERRRRSPELERAADTAEPDQETLAVRLISYLRLDGDAALTDRQGGTIR